MNVIDKSCLASSETSGVFAVLESESAADTAASAASAPAEAPDVSSPLHRPRIPAPAIPTQEGPEGIRFDYNDGCRLVLPEGEHPWRVRFTHMETRNVLFEEDFKSGTVTSKQRYFVPMRIEVWANGTNVFTHDYDSKDREVLVDLAVRTLGDPLAWFSYAVKFQERHGCRLTCVMDKRIIPLFHRSYPEITFLTADEVVDTERYYAMYRLGLFFDDKEFVYQPCDFRHVGLHRTAGYILGVDPAEMAPRVTLDDDTRPIAEPYVCIAVHSSTQCKYWNNPHGWREIVEFLKEAGYRVICIDKQPSYGFGLVWNHIPNGAENETGDRPLLERARWLKHADFFIGLGSGLSWLAWAMRIPVVMISGFSHPTTEFDTPYRVINYQACNSCWNDVNHRFDHKDFFWCPRHKSTPRMYECTRFITTDQVKDVLRRIPGFGAPAKSKERSGEIGT